MNPTPLPTHFDGRADQRGYKFSLIDRIGKVALYEKFNPVHPSQPKSYETVIVQITPLTTWPDGRISEPKESFPSPSQWGILAWTDCDILSARKRFNSVIEKLASSK